jgi:hypothetical protein
VPPGRPDHAEVVEILNIHQHDLRVVVAARPHLIARPEQVVVGDRVGQAHDLGDPRSQLLCYRNRKPITSRRRYDHLWVRIGKQLPWVATQQISTHWIRHTTLTWVERNYGYAVAKAFAGHNGRSDAGTTATYVRADLHEVARATAALTGEPHPSPHRHQQRPTVAPIRPVMRRRLTPLDPRRPSRDLLEDLLAGIRGCWLVYPQCIDYDALGDADDGEIDDMFLAAVRARATEGQSRLTDQ